MQFPKALRKASVISVLSIVSFLFTTKTAHAIAWGVIAKGLGGFLLGIGGKAAGAAATVAGIYGVVILLLHVITGVLLQLGNALIGVALDFNSEIINAAFVKGGYEIILGVANMGFIVALVVIAFGTMFRSDAFGYKKALPRLIIVALLINFSFFLVSQVLVQPVDLITRSINDASKFETLTASKIFDPRGAFDDIVATNTKEAEEGNERDYQDPCTAVNEKGECISRADYSMGRIPGFAQKIGAFLAATLLGVVFAFIGILALFAFAIMLFIRGLALAFLVILMPLAWAGLVFPNLKIPGGGNPWKVWWENFIRWLLFAPFAMFFLLLAVKLSEREINTLVAAQGNSMATAIGQMLVIVGLMLGGLIVANKMGITGSGYALALASKGKVWGEVQLKKYGHRGRRAFLGSKPMVEGTRKLKDVGKGWTPTLFGKRINLSKAAAPIRGAGRGVSGALEKSEGALAEEAFKREQERHPPEAFGEEGIAGLHPDAQAARIRRASENGTIWEIKDLEEVLAYEWEKIRARLPTQTRLKVEGQLNSPLSAYEHLKPIYDARKKGEFKDKEWNRYKALQKREGETQGAAEKATGLKKVELTTELARIRAQREALESSSTVKIGGRARSGFQQSVQAWMPTKSRSGLVAAEPELMEKRYEDGEFKPFYGRSEATTDIVRDAIQDARMEVRPDLLTSWNAKMFPDGLNFANAGREGRIEETNNLLRQLIAIERASDITPRDSRPKTIKDNWPDQARWGSILAAAAPQDRARFETIMQQGADTFIARFEALLSRRRQLAQATYDLAGALG